MWLCVGVSAWPHLGRKITHAYSWSGSSGELHRSVELLNAGSYAWLPISFPAIVSVSLPRQWDCTNGCLCRFPQEERVEHRGAADTSTRERRRGARWGMDTARGAGAHGELLSLTVNKTHCIHLRSPAFGSYFPHIPHGLPCRPWQSWTLQALLNILNIRAWDVAIGLFQFLSIALFLEWICCDVHTLGRLLRCVNSHSNCITRIWLAAHFCYLPS